jgi:sec-independent protein translocase protein TatC
VLFISGAAFCYLVALPGAFRFLVDWGERYNSVVPQIKLEEYLALVNVMIIGFGFIFQMPVVIAFLSMFGLVSARFLLKKFDYALLCIVIVAAVLSPTTDAFNLMIWSAPMIVLYFVSIGIAAIIGWRRKKKGLA